MSTVELDLSALSGITGLQAVLNEQGAPLQIPLIDIVEDPQQPRLEFAEHELAELTASIALRGVKTPISVRRHPSSEGKWILNYGARRLRASLAADKTTIPAFIDEDHDDYDQVIENTQRAALRPMEVALFIQKRLAKGEKKAMIARALGVDGSVITQHLALLNMPASLESVYRSGRCTSVKTIYFLRVLHERFSSAVDAWCENTTDITRTSVALLSEQLKSNLTRPEPILPAVEEGARDLKPAVPIKPELSVKRIAERSDELLLGQSKKLCGDIEGLVYALQLRGQGGDEISRAIDAAIQVQTAILELHGVLRQCVESAPAYP